jgi:hypothetical protein
MGEMWGREERKKKEKEKQKRDKGKRRGGENVPA